MSYKLVVDYGKPYEEIISTKEELFNRLKELKNMDKENHPYFDIFIYNDDEKEITAQIYKEFLKNNGDVKK